MTEISNIRVYDLVESVVACRNAMRLDAPSYTDEEFARGMERAKRLVRMGGGSGHTTFRSGIRVSFDIKYPNYLSPELQRYHWVDIVTSSSKMHKIVSMDMDIACNEYVDSVVKERMRDLIEAYNVDRSYERFMRVISSCPQGIELFMRVSTNYEQLATIYRQRKSHKLKEDWGAICEMIRSLPYSRELITNE